MKALINYYLKSLFNQPGFIFTLTATMVFGFTCLLIEIQVLVAAIIIFFPLIWMLVCFSILPVTAFSFQEMELSLPFSRGKIFFARLLTVFLLTFIGLTIVFVLYGIITRQTWDTIWFVNAVVWGLVFNALVLLLFGHGRHYRFFADRWPIPMSFFLFLLAAIVFLILITMIGTLIVAFLRVIYLNEYLISILIFAIGVSFAAIFISLAFRSYRNMSLIRLVCNRSATAPISRLINIAGVPQSSRSFFNMFRPLSVVVRVIMTEVFIAWNVFGVVLFFAGIITFVLNYTAIYLSLAVLAMIGYGSVIIYNHRNVLGVFAFMPFSRRRLFRTSLFVSLTPMVLIASIVLGVYCLRMNNLRNPKLDLIPSLALKVKNLSLHDIFKRYVNHSRFGMGLDNMIPTWFNRMLGQPCCVTDKTGYSRSCHILQKTTFLLDAEKYNPYSVSTNDPASFAAYQISRYVRDQYGLSLSSDDVINADKLSGSENSGHDYNSMALNVIRIHRNEMINATIKIKIGAILVLFVAMMWGATCIPAHFDCWEMKTTIKVLPLFFLLFFLVAFPDYWLPLFYPLMHIFNRLAVMHFGWLLTACALLSAAAYLVMERRFNSLEVGNIR